MGRHHPPRSPRRRLILGGASLSGVAAAAVLGLTYSHTIDLHLPAALASTPTQDDQPITVSNPSIGDPLVEPWVDDVLASLAPEPAPAPPEAETQPVPAPAEVEVAEEVEVQAAPAEPSVVNETLTPTPAPTLAPAAAPADWSGAPTPSSTQWTAWAIDVRPQVAALATAFGIDTVYTRPGHSPDQQHAADFMTTDLEMGNALAAYALSMPGVEYVIWQQRYNDGSGWSLMEDRGGATANHYDHVHVSFY